MKRFLLAAVAVLAIAAAIPALAPASLVSLEEFGVVGNTTPVSQPMCPGQPCEVLTRSTGFQTKVVGSNLFVVPRAGRVVAWTITLSKPTERQVSIFRDSGVENGVKKLGLGPASAGIQVLEPVKRPKGSKQYFGYKLISSSPVVRIGGSFGKTATFGLENSLAVKRGQVIALNVPTWAPALACQTTYAKTEGSQTYQACKGAGGWAWRASRGKGQCAQYVAPLNQTATGSVSHYECIYHGARLMYSATILHIP